MSSEDDLFVEKLAEVDEATGEVVPETPNYFDWREVYPQLQLLIDCFHLIKKEALSIETWVPWPEDHYCEGAGNDWTVFPFVYTFPANDESKSQWVGSTNALCPQTSRILRQIPGVRTALFSRIGPGTKLTAHTGWEDLANYVLRCHLNLKVPKDGDCGLIVDGECMFHKEGEIIAFDDSKIHGAFNDSPTEFRLVLIVDMVRPPGLPLGTAKGGHTDELDSFISQFR